MNIKVTTKESVRGESKTYPFVGINDENMIVCWNDSSDDYGIVLSSGSNEDYKFANEYYGNPQDDGFTYWEGELKIVVKNATSS